MEKKNQHSGIFEDKKKTARIMRNVFIVVAVVYVGLIIWSLCRQNYVVAAFDFVIMLLIIGYVYWCNALISDADLAISAIECERSRCDLIEAISRNHPWISVEERLPEENKAVLLWLGGCYKVALLRDNQWWECTGWQIGGGWSALDALSTQEVEYITHWMPIPEVPQ